MESSSRVGGRIWTSGKQPCQEKWITGLSPMLTWFYKVIHMPEGVYRVGKKCFPVSSFFLLPESGKYCQGFS